MNHDKMTNISAKRGFLWPSFEIYSGVSEYYAKMEKTVCFWRRIL